MKKSLLIFVLLFFTSVSALDVETTEIPFRESRGMNWLLMRSNFEVLPPILFINALRNNETIAYVNVSNDGVESFPDVAVSFTESLKDAVIKGFDSLSLPRKSARKVGFVVNSGEIGILEGNISFSAGAVNRTLPVIIATSDSDRIKVNVEVTEKVKAGKDLNAMININTGFVDKISFEVIYGIKTLNGEKVGENSLDAQMSGNSSSPLSIPVPKSAGVGDYYFYTIVNFNDKKYVATDYFNISTILALETIIISGFVLVIVAVVLGSVIKKKPKIKADYEVTGR